LIEHVLAVLAEALPIRRGTARATPIHWNVQRGYWQQVFVGSLVIALVFYYNFRKRRAGQLKSG